MLICLLSHSLFLKCLWGSKDSIFVHYVFQYIYFELCTNLGELLYQLFQAPFFSYHNILQFPFGLICCFQIGLSDLVIACIICDAAFYFIPLAIFGSSIQFYSLPSIHHWICANAHLWRIYHYIGLLELVTHFGNRCQWGRSFRGFKGSWFMH